MKLCIHEGLTLNPHSTLPDGSAEIGIKQLVKHILHPQVVADQLAFKTWRKKLLDLPESERYGAKDPMLLKFLGELSELIAEKKKSGKVAAVMAPWYEDTTLSKSEGYVRRIMEMDGRVLRDTFSVYLYECPYHKVNRIVVDRVREDRLYIRYNTAYKDQRSFVEKLVAMCDICYSHSVLRIIPMEHPEDESRWLNIFGDNTKHLLDAHGAVVEEALMVGDSVGAEYCRKAEKLYFDHVSACIVLTDSMRRYFEEKYGCEGVEFFKTPVLSRDIALAEGEMLDKSGPLTVVYAGGCQKWQNISLMQKAIRARSDAVYKIFVSSPDTFMTLWGAESLPENVSVKNGTPEEIKKAYLTAHYGFILRDDDPLNRVACPTKIMEYIQFDIVPIVKSPYIGDFYEMGLGVLSVEDFMEGRHPQDSEAVKRNQGLVQQLQELYTKSVPVIRNYIMHSL